MRQITPQQTNDIPRQSFSKKLCRGYFVYSTDQILVFIFLLFRRKCKKFFYLEYFFFMSLPTINAAMLGTINSTVLSSTST